MAEITITSENFEQEVLNYDKPVLIDFWAAWCAPCRMLAPIIEEIANENEDTIKVGKINIDEEAEIASQFGIVSIPTIILVKDGKIQKTSIGYKPKEEIEKIFK